MSEPIHMRPPTYILAPEWSELRVEIRADGLCAQVMIFDAKGYDTTLIVPGERGRLALAIAYDVAMKLLEERRISPPASVPEPPPAPPSPQSEPVYRQLRARLLAKATQANSWRSAFHGAIDLTHEREGYGLAKYGQPLMTRNGRNPIEDLRQELGDAMAYLCQAQLEGRHAEIPHDLIHVLKVLSQEVV